VTPSAFFFRKEKGTLPKRKRKEVKKNENEKRKNEKKQEG